MVKTETVVIEKTYSNGERKGKTLINISTPANLFKDEPTLETVKYTHFNEENEPTMAIELSRNQFNV